VTWLSIGGMAFQRGRGTGRLLMDLVKGGQAHLVKFRRRLAVLQPGLERQDIDDDIKQPLTTGGNPGSHAHAA
jgi:hypothetical protein